MKYINPGILDSTIISSNMKQLTALSSTRGKTTYGITQNLSDYYGFKIPFASAVSEVWVSFDAYEYNSGYANYAYKYYYFNDTSGNNICKIGRISYSNDNPRYWKPILYDGSNTVLYTPEDSVFMNEKLTHFEFHVKTGTGGIVEVFANDELVYAFNIDSLSGSIKAFGGYHGNNNYPPVDYYSSFIIQDTRRIGREEFKLLTTSPASAQTINAGGSASFTVSGLNDFSANNLIKSFGVITKSTNSDSDITTGTLTFDGNTIGTVNLSSSATDDLQFCSNLANYSKTDIDNKTLTLSVNGGA